MKTILDFLNGRCRFASYWLNAYIKRWTAITGMIISPTLFAMGLLLDYTEGLTGFAYVLHAIATVLFIPLLAEFSTTYKD